MGLLDTVKKLQPPGAVGQAAPVAPAPGPMTNAGTTVAPGPMTNAGTSVAPGPMTNLGGDHIGTSATPPPSSLADREKAAGIEDRGNNMVYVPSYGGMVDRNNPIYTNALGAAAAATRDAVGTSGSPSAITTQQQVGSTTAKVGGTIAQGAPTTVAESFQQALVNRLNRGPISSSSPEVAPAIQANQLAESRGMDRNRALLAERAAAQGQDLSGGFESQLLGLAQDRAGREGTFAGNAVMQGNQERGINDRAAMASAAGVLSGNANLSQQQQLAELEAQLRREGISAQTSLGQGDLALRRRLGDAGLNLGLLQALLQNSQYGKGLAQQGAQFGAGLDQSGLLALLGGL